MANAKMFLWLMDEVASYKLKQKKTKKGGKKRCQKITK